MASTAPGCTHDSVTFPGPLVAGRKGDTFRINVVDELTDTSMLTGTSVHWHGILQKGSNWADGPVGVNQCPISSGNSFQYQFNVKDQAGTFWYHSHYSTQYCDGLRGPLVIYDPDDPHMSRYDIDDESTIITLADWYHYVAPKRPFIPIFNSTLINGRGRFLGGPLTDLSVTDVTPFTRYRFRLVSVSCDPNFTFSIDGHIMTVIEVDGENVEPMDVDSIQIFAGQRYSFVLTADQPVSNYWIRAEPNLGSQGFENGLNSAILRYQGAPPCDPNTTQEASTRPLLEPDLHPLDNPAAPGAPGLAGADIYLHFGIKLGDPIPGRFSVNNFSFMPPPVPVLLQILSGTKSPKQLLPDGSSYMLPPNKVVEMSLPGGSVGSPHPIHLHGHSFSVIRSAGSTVYNYDNPVRRDVVNIGSSTNDNVTIRFTTDNRGPWIMHCHIDWHLDAGLAIVLAEADDEEREETQPTSWNDLCPTFDALPPQTLP
ncbi:hypothetical protein D9619_012985 [Psilocybe cf. subviscida]|uniref:Laccase n=1 Tax=Psilocybe cf. subviscida TaxID=2480587 RepID=A0A8H5BII4_9AGAR|nr:hypothetical protein D9619_012985 [Psilocybe cf. subviscida]